MNSRAQAAGALMVLAESLLWYIALRTAATALERDRFHELARDIRVGLNVDAWPDPERARAALEVAERAGESVGGGPPFLAIVGLAFVAFGLMRVLERMELPASARAAAGLLVSLVALGLATQLTLSSGAPWEGGMLGGNDAPARALTAEQFIATPDVEGVRGVSDTLVVVGLLAVWVRFLFAGRGSVNFERVLRSFGLGFAAAVIVGVVARAADAEVATGLLLAYFVLAALALATVHAARATPEPDALRREGPWMISVVATLGILAAVAMLFGLLAFVDAERVFEVIGNALIAVVELVLLIVLTPVAWLVERVLLLAGADPDAAVDFIGQLPEAGTGDSNGDAEPLLHFPGWMGQLVRAALILGVLWLAYRIGMWVFRRASRRREEEYVEERAFESAGGLGDLLRSLRPGRGRGGRRPSWDWLGRRPIYRLFGRMLFDAHERGIERRPGQTALEFGRDAGAQLGAPPFPAIARAFDEERYGRHGAPPEEIAALERDLEGWERE